jgi:protein gp37
MSTNSKIQWTNATWNCVTGCTRVSMGCRRCYAETMTRRLQAMGQAKYAAGFSSVVAHEDCLHEPSAIARPSMIFTNSMSDTFHADVLDAFIEEMFGVMAANDRHVFQVLTKRAERLAQLAPQLPWPANLWMGVTVEHANYLDRIDHLRSVPAAVRFLSLEPLLGSLPNLDLDGIHWVIVGGESGPGSTSVPEVWVTDIRDQCVAAGVAFFFKQWGSSRSKSLGRVLDGRAWEQLPK